jgi:hypothetical protein
MMKNSNISKIIKESINKVVSEAILKSYPYVGMGNNVGVSIKDKMESLGFIRCLTKNDYDGYPSSRRLTYRIPAEKLTSEIEKQLQTILNFYGYFLSSKTSGSDLYNGNPVVYITIETVYGNREETLDTYYHAANERKVSKILRQGLIPKSSDPMRKGAPSRIYLCKEPNEVLFDAVRGDDKYEIFKVDLSSIKNKIKVYTDNLASEDSVYTYDYIPPQCLSIIEKPRDIRERYISKIRQLIDNTICSRIKGLKTDGNKLIGSFENENKGTNVEVNVSFGDLARYYCLDGSDPMDRLGLEGRKIITYSNGRKRVVKIEKNFHKERIPNNLLAKRDRYVIADYLSVKMVNYLLKWLLS